MDENHLILESLRHLLRNASRHNSNIRFTLSKALKLVENDQNIRFSNLKDTRHVGPKIYRKIADFLKKNKGVDIFAGNVVSGSHFSESNCVEIADNFHKIENNCVDVDKNVVANEFAFNSVSAFRDKNTQDNNKSTVDSGESSIVEIKRFGTNCQDNPGQGDFLKSDDIEIIQISRNRTEKMQLRADGDFEFSPAKEKDLQSIQSNGNHMEGEVNNKSDDFKSISKGGDRDIPNYKNSDTLVIEQRDSHITSLHQVADAEDFNGLSNYADAEDFNGLSNNAEVPYIPAYKSSEYGILAALYKESGLRKAPLLAKAKIYSESRAVTFHSIESLVRKELITRIHEIPGFSSKKARYVLTPRGRTTAAHLFSNGLEDNTYLDKIELLIDGRERSKDDRNYFQQQCIERRIDFRTRNLPVGDFLWIRNVRGAEYLFDYVLERKKGDDFVHSILDGRFKEQKKRLLECGVKNVIYIVEGLKTRHFRKINAGFGLSCLYSTKVEGLLVVETDNIEDTMEFVSFVDKSIRTNPNAVLTNILFDQFADNSAKNININIKDLMYRTLLSIKGMTHERAKGLSEKYKTFANFFDKVKHEFEISNLQFEGKVVGENVARKIFDFFGLSGSK